MFPISYQVKPCWVFIKKVCLLLIKHGNKHDKGLIDQDGSISNAILLLHMIGPGGAVF